jgi:hypothetical protein
MSYYDDIYHIDSSFKNFVMNNPIDESKFSKFSYMLWKSFIKANLGFHSSELKYKDIDLNDVTLAYILDFLCFIFSSESENYSPEDIVSLIKEDSEMANYCKRLVDSSSKSETYRKLNLHNPNFIKSAIALASDKGSYEIEDIQGITQLSDHIANLVLTKFKSRSPTSIEILKNLHATAIFAKKWGEPAGDIERIYFSHLDLNKITKCMYANYVVNENENFWLLLYVTETDELSMVFQCNVNELEVFNYQLRDVYYENDSEPPENILDFYINKTGMKAA